MISSIFSFFHLIFMNNYPASAIYKKIIFFLKNTCIFILNVL